MPAAHQQQLHAHDSRIVEHASEIRNVSTLAVVSECRFITSRGSFTFVALPSGCGVQLAFEPMLCRCGRDQRNRNRSEKRQCLSRLAASEDMPDGRRHHDENQRYKPFHSCRTEHGERYDAERGATPAPCSFH